MRRPAPRLKWHKLRRRASDPPFQRENLDAALHAGAACEVDLVLTADGHALCLHDLELDRETTGSGPAAQRRRGEIEVLQQRDNEGRPLASPPLFLDEIVTSVRRQAKVAPARVQLDIKAPYAAFGTSAFERIGKVLGDSASAFIASGYEWQTVQRLCQAAPGLHSGFDPLAFYADGLPRAAEDFRKLAERTRREAPSAAIYYLEARLVLAALDRGVDLVSAVARGGAEIDSWTIDPKTPQVRQILQRLIEAGCHQITTNDPETLQPILEEIAACL